jgi:hypothetical protein
MNTRSTRFVALAARVLPITAQQARAADEARPHISRLMTVATCQAQTRRQGGGKRDDPSEILLKPIPEKVVLLAFDESCATVPWWNRSAIGWSPYAVQLPGEPVSVSLWVYAEPKMAKAN